MKLFPLQAIGILQNITGRYISNLYTKLVINIKKNDFSLMDELHHLTSGFKALNSQQAHDGILKII